MAPFFSIILTTYNRVELISEAVDSVVNQSFPNWELIIVDDGSTDNTKDKIEFYSDTYSNIKYKKIENIGCAGAKNIGIRRANGRYITFLDSDDKYKKGHLLSRFELLTAENIDLLHGGVHIVGDTKIIDKDNPDKLIDVNECFIGGTMFIKREVMSKLNGFPEIDYGEDAAFFEIVSKKHLSIKKTNIKTYIYNRLSSDSISNLKRNK